MEFQTVEWWIEQLKEFDPKTPVAIATGWGCPPLVMASIYKSGDGKRVWIDVEEELDETTIQTS